jgi:uncharacterized membrane protein
MKIKEPVPVKAEDITEFYRKATAVETSDSHKLACTTLFQKYNKFDKAHSHICYKITMAIRKYLLKEKADLYPTEVKSHELAKRTTTEASKGRIRYVGGYCIHQIRKKYLTLQQSRMYSLNILKQTEFDEASDKISILNSLREEEYFLKKSSCKPETLLDISEKQNLSKGLVHIPDELFDFFEHLCDFILSLLTFENFQRHGEDLHKFVLSKLLTSTDLQREFESVVKSRKIMNSLFFETHDDIPSTYILELFQEILKLFLKVVFNQFRRDILQSYSVSKTMEHRKQVQVKKKKKESQSITNVSFQTIEKDLTEGKEMSHALLKGLVLSKVDVFATFKKPEIQKLLKAYDIKFIRTVSKSDCIKLLQEAVVTCNSMKYPSIISTQDVQQATSSKEPVQESTHNLDEQDSFERTHSSLGRITGTENTMNEERPGTSRQEEQLSSMNVPGAVCESTEYVGEHLSDSLDVNLPSENSSDEDDGLCKKCQKRGREGVEWIQCNACLAWIHRNCAGLRSKKKWDHFATADFFCKECS